MTTRKALTGTTFKGNEIHLRKGYKFIPISNSEIAVAKIKTTAPKSKDGVSTRSYTVQVVGSYECRCGGRGSCIADTTVDPFKNIIYIHGCVTGTGGCRKGCELIIHFASTS
jgi:hypothetical protein